MQHLYIATPKTYQNPPHHTQPEAEKKAQTYRIMHSLRTPQRTKHPNRNRPRRIQHRRRQTENPIRSDKFARISTHLPILLAPHLQAHVRQDRRRLGQNDSEQEDPEAGLGRGFYVS